MDPPFPPRYHERMSDALSSPAPSAPVPDPARLVARLGHVREWIFDLDNTLYPASNALFAQIEERMAAYMMRVFGLRRSDAQRLRREYWRDHGTTLAGLMRNHRTDPDAFLDEVHRIDFSVLRPDPRLRAAMLTLPGRRIVFTNGTSDYARRVIAALGLDGCFEAVYGIREAFYTPKPLPAAYQRIFGADGLDPRRAAMFEDDPRNLEVPHALGVACVLVGPEARPDLPHVDFATDDLAGFVSRLGPLLRAAPRLESGA